MLDMYVTRAGGGSCHVISCFVMYVMSCHLMVMSRHVMSWPCPDVPSSPAMADGLSLLDLGCGWGSVALYMAAKFPNSQGEGVS